MSEYCKICGAHISEDDIDTCPNHSPHIAVLQNMINTHFGTIIGGQVDQFDKANDAAARINKNELQQNHTRRHPNPRP